jgi:hypothetical protein
LLIINSYRNCQGHKIEILGPPTAKVLRSAACGWSLRNGRRRIEPPKMEIRPSELFFGNYD